MSKLDDIIGKSLEEIDAIVTQHTEDVSKALTPDEVSSDTPEEGQEAPDAGADDNADADVDNEPEEDEAADEEVEKSLEAELKGNEPVRKALEVSEFLDNLVKGISGKLLASEQAINKSLEANNSANEVLAKSFEGIAKSQKVVLDTQVALLKSIQQLGKRMEQLESQPQVRKSVSSAKVIDKSFEQSAGAPAAPSNQLSKSEISAKLFQGVQDGKVESHELLAFESLGSVGALSSQAKTYLNIK